VSRVSRAGSPLGARWIRIRTWLARHRGAGAAALGLGSAAIVLVLRAAGLLVPLELAAYDAALRARAGRSAAVSVAPPDVVLVAIREDEVRSLGHPLPDGVLARTLEALLAAGPRALGVDLYRDLPVGEGGEALRRVGADPRLVWIEKRPDASTPGVPPPPWLRGRCASVERCPVGYSDVPLDPGGVARRGDLYMWDAGGRPHLSFAWRLALLALGAEGIRPQPDPDDPSAVGLRLGAARLRPFQRDDGGYVGADDGNYQLLLDFARGAGGFPVIPLGDVLAGGLDAAAVRDRVAILGTMAPSVRDDFQTPLGVGMRGGRSMPGAELHAHAVDELLRRAHGAAAPTRVWPEPAEVAWIALSSLVAALLGMRARSIPAGALACAVAAALCLGGGAIAFAAHTWIPVAAPAAASSLALLASFVVAGGHERAERRVVTRLFSRHVSAPVLNEILRQRESYLIDGRPRPRRAILTVLMADVEGFTAACERLAPEDAMAWIDSYLDVLATLVLRSGGVVDDYWGDGMKANFGVPEVRADEAQIDADARAAVACALAMDAALRPLNERSVARGLPPARLRIGLHTGEAVVGSLGSDERLKYTSVGDTVNLASRLESLEKDRMPTDGAIARIWISEATAQRLGGRFRLAPEGSFHVHGRSQAVVVHRVLGRAEETS
jgi:adenylate cyclase